MRRWQSRFQRALQRLGLPDYTVFSIFAIFTGAVAGVGAALFHKTIELFSELFLHGGPKMLWFLGPAGLIAIPMIGMLLQSLLIRLAPEVSQHRSVLDVIKAVTLRGGYIPFKTTLFHFFAPALSMGSGATVGPEGPAAQIGAGLASKLSRILGLSESRRKMFTAAGSGAAIAAVFNTPLGGIFFALEIILLNDFQSAIFAALILASVTASAIAHLLIGNKPAFTFEAVNIGPPEQLVLYAVLGVGAGVLSLLFIQYSDRVGRFFSVHALRKMPQWVLMGLIGLVLGICGYFFNDILGIGYSAINKMLASELPWQTVLALLLMKFLLVPMILKSGGFGGIFAPSLFIGAAYGFLFSFGLNQIFGLNLHTTSFVLVGMGATLGGINSIPISSILILFEMTRDYSFMLPLMLGVVVSTTLVQLIVRGSIHTKHLEQQGYHIARGTEMSVLKSMRVSSVMRKDIALIPQSMPLPQLIQKCIEQPYSTFYTVDDDGGLNGLVSSSELRPVISEYEHLRGMLIAADIASEEVVTVTKDDDLDHVLRLIGYGRVDELPVVDPKNPRKVIGVVARQDVISAYQRESLKVNITDGFARSLKALKQTHAVPVAEGYSIVERKVPKKFIGKSLAQLRLRNKFDVEVLMIMQEAPAFSDEENGNGRMVSASPNYVIQPGDTLLIFGRDEQLDKTREWG